MPPTSHEWNESKRMEKIGEIPYELSSDEWIERDNGLLCLGDSFQSRDYYSQWIEWEEGRNQWFLSSGNEGAL